MNQQFAEKFAQEWINAWNSHDINIIMSHYADDFKMTSPVIQLITDEETGRLDGIETVRDYWNRALKMNPKLNFELIKTFTGVNSLIIHYKGHRGFSAETFFFNKGNKVNLAYAHYENLSS